MNKTKLYVIFAVFATGISGLAHAQQIEKDTVKKKIQWGLRITQSGDGLVQSGKNEEITTGMEGGFLLGAFAECEKASLDMSLGYSYFDTELSYKFYRNWAVVGEFSTGTHWLDIERTNFNSYYGYTQGDAKITQYSFGAGYHNTFWNRLKLKAHAKIGGVKTNKAEASGMIDPSSYSYGTNKKALKTDVYQLSSSFIYGADLYLEILPRMSKKRKTPLVPFFKLSIMGSGKSDTFREVNIEEWIPGNVVYHEISDDKYELSSLKVQLGLKWYLKYGSKTP